MSTQTQSLLAGKSWNKSRLNSYYKQIIVQDYLLKQNIKNLLEIPKILQLTLHFTSSAVVNEKKFLVKALVALQLLSGQQASILLAKKSISTFKIRKKQLIGCKVTLRKNNLYFFLDTLINVVIPQLDDLEILRLFTLNQEPKNSESSLVSFLSHSNSSVIQYQQSKDQKSFGVKNLLLFPQLENHFQDFESLKGVDVIVNTSCSSNHKLLKQKPLSHVEKVVAENKRKNIMLSGFQISA